jgi:hypothetical protein
MADITVDATVIASLNQVGIRSGPVWIDVNTAYVFYSDSGGELVYQKTSDGGATWGSPVLVHAGAATRLSIWYDRWTPGNAGTLVHMAYLDTGTDDVFYRSIDTVDDTLGTETVVFAGASFSSGSWVTGLVDVVRARGGNLYIGFWGDADGEFGFYRSTDNGATWTSRAQLADGNLVDGILLMPGDESDEDDIWCLYLDVNVGELSLKVYDNSGDSWGETAISSPTIDRPNTFYQMSASPRHSDNHVIWAVWTNADDPGADLRIWDIGGSDDITALTDVVTDLAESAQVALLLNQQNGDIYVAYLKGGTWLATVDVVYRKSTDGGTTWGDEQSYSEAAADDIRALWAGISVGPDGGRFQPLFYNDDLGDIFVNLVNSIYIAPSVLPLRDAYAGATVDEIPSHGSARS